MLLGSHLNSAQTGGLLTMLVLFLCHIYGRTHPLHNRCVVSFYYTGLLVTACSALVAPNDVS